MNERDSRRAFLTIAGASALLVACRDDKASGAQASASASSASSPSAVPSSASSASAPDEGDEVGAVEDLMREHGAIRRVLVVYREAAQRVRVAPASVPPEALRRAAKLMQSFGENYHEKKLEEAHIFPAVAKANAPLAAAIATLVAQHQRGREITEYVLAVTQKAVTAQVAEPLARTLDGFARMYEEHAAIEDTVIFPAWKKALSPKELDAMGEKFEDIEHDTFGKDGFDDAVDEVTAIEKLLGIDLGAMTPPPPPKP
jgi:hemerythrin-like domain-containing protein